MRLFCSVNRKIFACLSGVCLCIVMLWVLYQGIGHQRARIHTTWVIEVAPGAGWRQVVRTVAAHKMYSAPRLLEFYLVCGGYMQRLKSGEYELFPDEPWSSFVDRLVRAQVKQYTFTVVPGRTWADIQKRIAGLPLSEKEDYQAFVLPSLEGYFYPDTYFFTKNASVHSVLMSARQRFMSVLSEIWAERDPELLSYTAEDLVVIASLIEREAKVEADRAKIARVIYNRLALDRPLQIDASMVYVMHTRGMPFRASDLKEMHPYNTYRIRGLPPGPIAYPSRASLEAAAHPVPGTWLYYRLGPDGRSHLFSHSFEEHKQQGALCQ